MRELSRTGSRVSLFIEAKPEQIEAAKLCQAPVIEIHTGAYAHALDDEQSEQASTILEQIQKGAKFGQEIGLEIHAGHGITFDNVNQIASIPEVKELNIGHFLIGESVFSGLDSAIKTMRQLMDDARA